MESSGKSRLGTQLFVLLYALLLLRTAWLCDDAYTTFRTVENVFQGYGPTYNPGERVQTFTHPLWMLVLCAGRCVSSDPYRVAMCLSLGLSLITVLLLVRAPSVTPVGAMLGVGILSLSRAFMDFSTSGLENPLTHLLLVLFLLSATNPIRSQGTQNRAGLWVLAGLSILNRMDIALLFLPWMAHTAWEGVRARRARGLLPALVGLSPFIAWEVFALVYYGFPFPNTAYAKLSSGLPWYALARQGVGYLANSVAVDPLTPLTIVAASIFALESREKALKDQLRATGDELETKTDALRERERTLADKEAELARLTGQVSEHVATSDSQRVEIVALKTQVENLKDQVAGLGRDVKETGERHAREKEAAEKATQELTAERGTVEKLGSRIGELERQLATQTAEAEIMGKRMADLEQRLAEHARLLADRERERDQLRTDLEASRRIETDLRQELGTIDRRHNTATESLRAEKTLAESQLERAREDRSKLQHELSLMKREAEATWASERVENALLRERINDVAAEVARLTATLEGPGSAIDTILATPPDHVPANSNGSAQPAAAEAAEAANGDGGKGSLADRIRALQARSSRLTSAT